MDPTRQPARRRAAVRFIPLRVAATCTALAALWLAACEAAQPEDEPAPSTGGSAGAASAPVAGTAGVGGVAGTAGSAGTGAPSTGGTAGTGGTNAVAGAGQSGVSGSSGAGSGGLGGGQCGAGGCVPSAGTSSGVSGSGGDSSVAGSAGTGGVAHTRDHCVEGFEPDPADSSMIDGPAEYSENNQIDLTVQPAVLAWMEAHEWEAAHFEWHSIRRCNGGMSQSRVNICSHTEMIPVDQECKTDGDGFQFLAMHRHMIQSLKQLFPNHTEQFEGFDKFPQSASDVPEQWRAAWQAFSSSELANAKIADEIDKPENLSLFASEGAFGRWLQCLAPQYSGLHGALHFKWVRTQNTTHGLGNQFANIDNYMFWKLHGWIDKVWEKYRIAKGLSPDDPALKDAVVAQCREMDKLAEIINPDLIPDPGNEPLPPESGQFHETVRPIFESENLKCSGCHGPVAPEAGQTLGGHVSSADIVANIVNVPSIHGGQFLRIKPGDPDHSWLYLKIAGLAADAGCVESNTASCNPQQMPPSSQAGARATTEQLEALRAWILAGAPAPTSP